MFPSDHLMVVSEIKVTYHWFRWKEFRF
jgi:hypothetical protein